jgi:hypothetical protein
MHVGLTVFSCNTLMEMCLVRNKRVVNVQCVYTHTYVYTLVGSYIRAVKLPTITI